MSDGFHGPGIVVFPPSGGGAAAETQTAISGIANSETTYTSGTVSLSALGNLTIASGTGQVFKFSVDPSGGAETQTAISGIANSETTYTSGTVSWDGANNITVLSTTGQRFRISGPNTHAVQTGISGISNSETTFTSGTVGLSVVGGNITIRSTTGNAFQFSGPGNQTVQAESFSVGVSTGGNTAGDTGVATGQRLVFSGQGQVSLSQATGANSTTIGISIPNSVAQSVQAESFSIGVSTGGNTAGNTTVNSGTRYVFSGQNNITLSQSTVAGATTLGISGPNTAAQSVQAESFSVGVSTGGNTAGDTTVNTGTRLVFSGQANITLSQATAAGATTVGISAPNPGGGAGVTGSYFHNMEVDRPVAQYASMNLTNSTSYIQPVNVPYAVSASFARLSLAAATQTASVTWATTANSTVTASLLSTFNIHFFTQNVGLSSMSLKNFASGSAGFTQQWSVAHGTAGSNWTVSQNITYPQSGGNTASTQLSYNAASSIVSIRSADLANFTGTRFLDIPFASSLSEGPYWVMYGKSSSFATQVAPISSLSNMRINASNLIADGINVAPGDFNATTNASIQVRPALGSFSTLAGATTASLAFSNVSSSGSNPWIPFALHRTA